MKKFWIYILVTFGMGWLMQGLGILSLNFDPTGLAYTGLLAICMFAPLFGTLAANGGIGRKAGIRWKPRLKGKVRWWLSAWFGPAAPCLHWRHGYGLKITPPRRISETALTDVVSAVSLMFIVSARTPAVGQGREWGCLYRRG